MPGVYSIKTSDNERGNVYSPSTALRLNLIRYSDKVWREGPKGGVKIVKDRVGLNRNFKYVTHDPKAMKEFAWIKLSAKSPHD
jgi:hypothetical protein